MRKKLRNGYNDNTKPVADTSLGVHEAIVDMICKGRGKALDLGAGFGLLSKKISDLGYDVTTCELDPVRISHIRKLGLKCDRVDLNGRLPYKSGSFDLIVSSDVIEHLRYPQGFVQEIGRVAKKGGTVVITTPNIANWYSRLKFLFSGVYNNYFTEKEFEGEGYHISPIYFYQLRWMLEQAGFALKEMGANQYSGLINFSGLRIFLSSLFVIPCRVFMKPKNKPLLEGDILVVKAVKVK